MTESAVPTAAVPTPGQDPTSFGPGRAWARHPVLRQVHVTQSVNFCAACASGVTVITAATGWRGTVASGWKRRAGRHGLGAALEPFDTGTTVQRSRGGGRRSTTILFGLHDLSRLDGVHDGVRRSDVHVTSRERNEAAPAPGRRTGSE